jgi:hypothetical protein
MIQSLRSCLAPRVQQFSQKSHHPVLAREQVVSGHSLELGGLSPALVILLTCLLERPSAHMLGVNQRYVAKTGSLLSFL